MNFIKAQMTGEHIGSVGGSKGVWVRRKQILMSTKCLFGC